MPYVVGRCLLRKIMRSKGLSQVDIAVKTNRSEAQISAWASGKRKMNLVNAYEISQVLGCHIEDLYEFVPKNG